MIGFYILQPNYYYHRKAIEFPANQPINRDFFLPFARSPTCWVAVSTTRPRGTRARTPPAQRQRVARWWPPWKPRWTWHEKVISWVLHHHGYFINVGKTMPCLSPIWEWFIPPIRMVIWGMVYYYFTHIIVIYPQVIKRGWLENPLEMEDWNGKII